MNEEQAKTWVKDKTNQDKVVAQFFDAHKPLKNKVALFMAGIPGAGKTEFSDNTIRESAPSFISIEHDKLVEFIDGYTPETYYNYRKAGSVLVTRIFDECLKNGYTFVFDGTLSSENGIRNINKCLKKGYRAIIVYLVQDAQKAWELTQARELVKKRSIERKGFLETCNKINVNLLEIFQVHKDNPNFEFWLINKQGEPDMKKATVILHTPELRKTEEIESALKIGYNIDIGN
ncbi:MAG: zeta toxin family protein [Patescibacteria group bacterium]|nr:zeta toxin family protein [Patescibacteria group bacterium]